MLLPHAHHVSPALPTCSFCPQVPAGKTDQVQPIDDGAGQQYKVYIGQAEDAWLEDDENLRKWENEELTASDRRILLANWYVEAHHRIVKSRAIRKYFEHTGALLTADGTGDDLIKLEGMPKGHVFTWGGWTTRSRRSLPRCLPPSPTTRPTNARRVTNRRKRGRQTSVTTWKTRMRTTRTRMTCRLPRAPPQQVMRLSTCANFPPAALEPKKPEQQQLVGKSILYRWPSVGWCVGVVTEANGDSRK